MEDNNIQIVKEVNENKKVRFTSNMILFLTGRFVSLFGTQVYNFAIALYVLKETGSGLAFSATLIFGMLPRIILGPFIGVLADRVDRKKVVVGADIISGIIVFAFLGAVTFDGFKLIYIYIASILLTTANTFFDTCFGASIPNLVDDSNLMRLNSLNQSMSSVASISGPFLGGLVYGLVDIKFFLIANGVSFILSGIEEMFIDFNYNKPEKIEEDVAISKEKNEFLKDLVDGFKYIKSQKSIFIMFCFAVFVNFFFALGLQVPLPFILNKELLMSSTQFGTLEAMFPVGMLVGSIALSVLPETKKKYKPLIIGLFLVSFIIILFGAPIFFNVSGIGNNIWFIYYMFIIITVGVALVFINIPISVLMQRLVPDHMRGRVIGLLNTMAMAISPIGMLISGIFLEWVPAFLMPISTGVILILITFMMASNKEIQKL